MELTITTHNHETGAESQRTVEAVPIEGLPFAIHLSDQYFEFSGQDILYFTVTHIHTGLRVPCGWFSCYDAALDCRRWWKGFSVHEKTVFESQKSSVGAIQAVCASRGKDLQQLADINLIEPKGGTRG